MRITDINAKRKTKNARLQFKTQNFKFWVVVFTFAFLLLPLLAGCAQKNELEEAQDYLKKSKIYYQRATDLYKDLIAKGKDLDKLHFELGQLYYNQGERKQAIEEFKKSGYIKAKKFLAISYYRLGNFTDALEVFNREEIPDDEYLYYHGLTCEKLNLFDQALSIYKKIKTKEFAT
ncbi:MAG: tetratricopeptide repeat protein, partial [Candidatus Omnitrophota bacterium]